jgi:TMEM175 potassium channel family protein
MSKNRLEAFSDGVFAIIITIMVLELKVPHSAQLTALFALWPIFLSYVLSFVFLGIYWNNHHHMLHAVGRVTGRSLWANLHLLFWLSLAPFVTGWMGENHFATLPVALYGVILLCAACAYWGLQRSLIKSGGPDCQLAGAVGNRWKENLSPALYAAAIGLAFVHPLISCALYVVVAVIWLMPDPRIERIISSPR